MSNFGADIFDQQQQPEPEDGEGQPPVDSQGSGADPETPEPAPTKKKAARKKSSSRRSSSAKADEGPESPAEADEAAPDHGAEAGDEPEGQAPAEGEAAPRRRKTTRSRRKPAEEDDSDRSDSPRTPRRSSQTASGSPKPRGRSRTAKGGRASTRGAAPSTRSPARASSTGQQTARVGILMDLDVLQKQAHEAGGELAFLKLIKLLADNRTLCGAFGYTTESSDAGLPPSSSTNGLSVRRCTDKESAAVALTIDAMGMIEELDALVLAPMPPNLQPLLDTLAQRGISVEVASFGGESPEGTQPRSLGSNCLFVP